MMEEKTPKGSSAYARYESSSCHGAFATTSAVSDNLGALIKNAIWLPSDSDEIEAPPVLDQPRREGGSDN